MGKPGRGLLVRRCEDARVPGESHSQGPRLWALGSGLEAETGGWDGARAARGEDGGRGSLRETPVDTQAAARD